MQLHIHTAPSLLVSTDVEEGKRWSRHGKQRPLLDVCWSVQINEYHQFNKGTLNDPSRDYGVIKYNNNKIILWFEQTHLYETPWVKGNRKTVPSKCLRRFKCEWEDDERTPEDVFFCQFWIHICRKSHKHFVTPGPDIRMNKYYWKPLEGCRFKNRST